MKVSDLLAELSVASFNFTGRSCSMVEHCIAAPGLRRLLRFSVGVLNQGAADVALPDPTQHPLSFFFSTCHQHYHYNHFAEYSLIRNNSVQLVGHKQVQQHTIYARHTASSWRGGNGSSRLSQHSLLMFRLWCACVAGGVAGVLPRSQRALDLFAAWR